MKLIPLILLGAAAASAQNYVDPGMKKVVQVAIVCKDIEACSKHWAAVLGVDVPKITITRPGHEVKLIYKGKISDGQAKLAFFNEGQVTLELTQPVGGPTSWKDGLDKNGESVHHIAFEVQDLEKTIESFVKQGMGVIHRGRFDKENGDYVYVDSQKQLGVTVELLHHDAPPPRVP
jgi:methylmalonyl-CoA/ethylmalonyl-CoA epimerase